MTSFRTHAVPGWLLTCALAAVACSSDHRAPAKQAPHPADTSNRTDGGASGGDGSTHQGSGGSTQPSAGFNNPQTAVDAAVGAAEPDPPDVLRAGADAELQCPTITACQAKPLELSSRLLASSANIADDARFVAIADEIILAERGTDAQPVALRVRGAEVIEFTDTLLTHPKAIAIAGDSEVTFSLLCDDDGSCEVFALRSRPSPSSTPERVASIGWPTALTGIVAGGCTMNPYQFCVFGDALLCFDGASWTTELSADPGERILAVAVDHRPAECHTLLIAGTHGMLQRYHMGWQAIDTGVTADLTAIGAYSGRFTATGGDVLIEGDPYGFVVCKLDGFEMQKVMRVDSNYGCSKTNSVGNHVDDEDATKRGFNSMLRGITTQGQVVIGNGGCDGAEMWTCDQQSAPNIDFSLVACGTTTVTWQLSPDELNGIPDNACPID